MAAPELYAPRRPPAKRPRQASRPAAEPGRRRGLVYRALTSGVAITVLGGFGYYAWAAYSGDHPADVAATGVAVALIEASDDPIKVPPENPGGIAAPGAEYEFFAGMNGERLEVRPDEEFVLPPPEAPIVELTPDIFDRPPPVPPELTLVSVASADEPAVAEVADKEPPAAEVGVNVPPVLADALQPLPVVEPSALVLGAEVADAAAGPRSAIDALVASIAGDQAAFSVASAPAVPQAAPEPAAAAATAPAGSATVQLASMASQDLAQREWERLRRLLPDLLANREPIIRSSTSNDRTYYRVSVAAGDRVEAAALCAEIKNRSFDCIVHN